MPARQPLSVPGQVERSGPQAVSAKISPAAPCRSSAVISPSNNFGQSLRLRGASAGAGRRVRQVAVDVCEEAARRLSRGVGDACIDSKRREALGHSVVFTVFEILGEHISGSNECGFRGCVLGLG